MTCRSKLPTHALALPMLMGILSPCVTGTGLYFRLAILKILLRGNLTGLLARIGLFDVYMK
jgi:hypothetical protein